MKKFIFSFLCGMLIVSCCSEPNPEPDSTSVAPPLIKDYLIGEWVADYAIDDPMGYRWEIIKFLESGELYFSNYSDKNKLANDYINGNYTVNEEDSTVSTSCILGWSDLYETYNTTIHLSNISDYEFKAELSRGGKIIEAKTYKKVIGEIELEEDETTPDYKALTKGRTILGYKSHNSFIASVAADGKIKKGWSGSTYIDIETDKGTALIQVTVNNILYFDYLDCIGKPAENIVDVFDYGYSEDNKIYYLYNSSYYPDLQRQSGNWKAMGVSINPATNLVEAIVLIAKDDVWFTDYQIYDFLKQYYTVYEKGTENTYKAFLSGDSFLNSEVGVAWDNEYKTLSFIAIQKRVFIEIKNEDYLPDYKDIVGDATIQHLSSRNDYIATVDESTGIIRGIDSGKTIIDILTDQGTASIHITVKAFIVDDYESLIGSSRTNVNNFYGVMPSYADNDDLIFKFNSLPFPEGRREVGNWDNMIVKMTNPNSGIVTAVVLTSKEDAWFSAEEMNEYLCERFYAYNDDTTENNIAYLNSDKKENATVEILWDMTNKILTFKAFSIPKSIPVYDFGRYMGKTREEAKEMITAELGLKPLSDTNNSLTYIMGNDQIDAVIFSFNSTGSIQSIQVRLAGNVDKDDVKNELDSIYPLFASDEDQIIYQTSDNKIRVYYLLSYNTIKYQWR